MDIAMGAMNILLDNTGYFSLPACEKTAATEMHECMAEKRSLQIVKI